MPVLLLKFAPYLIALVIVGGLCDYIFEQGKKVERSIWQAKELKAQAVAQDQLTAAYAEINKQRSEHQVKIAEAVNAKEQESNQLRTRVNDLHSRGLYVSAKCQGNQTSARGKTDSAKQSTGPSNRVRLSKQDEENLIAIANDAQKVVIQYNALLKVCTPLLTTN